jgi:hypothetical protein
MGKPANRCGNQAGIGDRRELGDPHAIVRASLTAIVIDTGACRRWLAADPPDIGPAQATTERMASNANALSRLSNTGGHDDLT